MRSELELQLSGHQVNRGGAGAFVRHMRRVDFRHLFQQFPGQMTAAAIARRAVNQRLRLRQRDQVLHLVHRQRWMHHQNQRRFSELRHCGKILQGIVGQFFLQMRQHGVRRVDDAQRMTIRRCTRRQFGTEDGARAAAIVHHHLITQRLSQPLGGQATQKIGSAPGWRRHDHAYRTRRVFGFGLCNHHCRQHQQHHAPCNKVFHRRLLIC